MVGSPPPTILVVDDEPDICQNLADILEEYGYVVETALNGEEALHKIRERRVDIALLDFKMPGMDGLTLYRKIREEQAGVVAVIVTAYASTQTTHDALEAGAWKVLSKPVDLGHLLSLVDDALHQPTVMVVDDDVDLCRNLWEIIRDRGYRVCLAHTTDEALRILSERDFQVILVDLAIPRGTGLEVLDTLHTRAPKTRSILITAHRDQLESSLSQPDAPRVDAVCLKPFDIPELLQTIERLTQPEE